MRSNLLTNASCSSDTSSDSSQSRASTGRVSSRSVSPSSARKKQCSSKVEKIGKVASEAEGLSVSSEDVRVTSNTGSRMAPKTRQPPKRKRGASLSQAPSPTPLPLPTPTYRVFHTAEAQMRYQNWISTREFKKERGLEVTVPRRWNWGPRFLAQPGAAFTSLVREFYANAGEGLQTDSCIVREVKVSFSAAAINNYYGTKDYLGTDYYHNDLQPGTVTGEKLDEIATSFHPNARWNIRHRIRANLDYQYFSVRDRGILDFIKAKLTPYSHRGAVPKDQVLLAYCIKEHLTIDVGAIINRSICEIAGADEKSRCFLSHPALITALCRNAGVLINEAREPKILAQQLLTERYVNKRYGQGQRVANDDEEEEEHGNGDEEMGDTEDHAHHADLPPVSIQYPPDFDLYSFQQFMRRQDEVMRKQDEVMKKQDEVMRRQNEVNWYVCTSMHALTQKAQGFAPFFPPPPPWLLDPQFIPEYCRSHFPPPPPPDGDPS